MRVIAGVAKGRKLKSPRTAATRPILSRVKAALFDLLGQAVVNASFLDLFAGTGSVGIEALSRGAKRAVFVDISPAAIRVIKENLRLTGLADRAQVVRKDVLAYIQEAREETFDIIYVAPPQWKGLIPPVLQAIDRAGILADQGLVITQQHPKEAAPVHLTNLEPLLERRYGDTLLSFYRRTTAARVTEYP